MSAVDVDMTLAKERPKPMLVNARIALASVSVERALGPEGRRRLQRESSDALVVTVPSTKWVEPVASAIRLMASVSTLVTTSNKHDDVVEALADGRSVVGVSEAPPSKLPMILLDFARHVAIPPPDGQMVRAAMKRCLVGRMPATLDDVELGHVDFDYLCAAMSTGLSKREAAVRIARLATPSAAPPIGLKLPPLHAAIEYGAARTWGLDLAQDFSDLKAGRIAARDLDRGAILVADPGIGKSTFSRVLADACKVPLISGSISELFGSTSGYLDAVVKGLRKLFSQAQAAAPCILFLDEITSLPSESSLGQSRNRDYWMPLIHEFYLLLDSTIHGRDGIVVIGATNSSDISPALSRPGRLERIIHIEAPSPAAFAQILRTQLGTDLAGIDLGGLAHAAQGATAAIAMDWVRSARRTARRAGRSMDLSDLDAQVFSIDTRNGSELHRAAIHEAGHAVVGEKQGLGLISISIRRLGMSGGRTRFADPTSSVSTAKEMAMHIRMMLGGLVAEQLLCGGASTGSGGDPTSDLAQATILAAAMRASFGLAGDLSWRATPDRVFDRMQNDPQLISAVEADLRRYRYEVAAIIRKYHHEVRSLALRLIAELEVRL